MSTNEKQTLRSRFGHGFVGRWLPFLAGIALFGCGSQLRAPLLLKVRGLATLAVVLGGLLFLGMAVSARRMAKTKRSRIGVLLLFGIGLGNLGQAAFLHGRFALQRSFVHRLDAVERARLGRHIVAGFRSWKEAQTLVSELLVGGIYVGQHNAKGLSAAELQAHIAELVALRQNRGLPPLLVTTDQEGGPVSRLSPPLPMIPPLSAVIDGATSAKEREQRIRAYAVPHARALRELGININFSPVTDLRFFSEASLFDRYSFIGARAVSADPQLAASVLRSYSEVLRDEGIIPTAKHFPGLGRVRTDTHFFTATLNLSEAELAASDWIPIRAVLAVEPSLLMLGHVILREVDKDNIAAGSALLLRDIVREKWHHQGVLITDDLCMGPVFYGAGSVPKFAVRSLRAGVDLLLISYDGSQVYSVLAELARAARSGELPADLLAKSAARIERLTPFVQAAAAHK